MRQNLKTSLRRRRPTRHPMAEYDALPPVLRHWLAGAALQWSAAPVRKAWKKALSDQGGCERRAIAQMDEIERRLLARDARAIWGEAYPFIAATRPRKAAGGGTAR